jgi:peptidoglycan/LPS O-acetylase OafA/YrhL
MNKTYLPGIQGLRAIASICVVIFHVCYINKPSLAVPWVLSVAVSHMGLSVHLFFIISAFSLMHTYHLAAQSEGWLTEYFIKRFFRIAPLFYMMLIFNYGVFIWNIDPWVVLANVTFTYNFFPPLFGSVIWAGWTLGVEFPIYLVLPLLIGREWKTRYWLLIVALTFVISFAARTYLVGPAYPDDYAYYSLFSNLAAFGLGCLAFQCVRKYPEMRQLFRLSAILGVVCLLVLSDELFHPDKHFYPTLFWFIPLTMICIWQAQEGSPILSSKFFRWAGDRSYSIYLWHPFVVYLLMIFGFYTWIYAFFAVIGSWAFVPACCVTIAIVFCVAELSYRLIERPGQKIGTHLLRKLRPGLEPSIA